jgi:hypothetical protein
MTNIPRGIIGHIRNEGVSHPYVLVEDDNSNGYLIYTSTIPDFYGPGAGPDDCVFDVWVLKDELDDFFQEKAWEIDWSADSLSDIEGSQS